MSDQPNPEGISFDKQPGPAAPSGDQPSYPGVPPSGYAPGAYVPPGYGSSAYPPAYGPAGYGGYPPHPGYGYAPGPPPGPPPGPKPSNNVGWSIAAIFLFWPLCIPSFIAGSRVDGAWFAGDFYGAQKASDDAKKYGMIGVIIGGSLIALYFIFVVVIFGLIATSA